jgi:hypothetical protein
MPALFCHNTLCAKKIEYNFQKPNFCPHCGQNLTSLKSNPPSSETYSLPVENKIRHSGGSLADRLRRRREEEVGIADDTGGVDIDNFHKPEKIEVDIEFGAKSVTVGSLWGEGSASTSSGGRRSNLQDRIQNLKESKE